MEPSKTILVPIDFEECSLAALAAARDLGQRLGLEVVLFHAFTVPVLVYPGYDYIIAPGLPDEIASAARTAVEHLAAKNGVTRTLVCAGDPATEILKAIDDTRPALVAMGTHGRKGLSHLLLGSVTEKVIRASSSPVLSIRVPAQ